MADEPAVADDRTEALIDSIALTPIATVVADLRLPDYPIIAVNDAWVALTGFAREETVGRNCRFLQGEATEAEARNVLRDAIANGRPACVELTNYRKDGTPFRNAVMIAPALDERGRPSLFVGSQADVSEGGLGLRETKARDMVRRLTERQKQVLRLMTAGYRNKQIGGMLGIDEKTVKMHRARLIEALGVPTSADAIRIAVEAGPVADDDRG